MSDWKTHVLIQMKSRDAIPGDTGFLHQCRKRIELRSAGGDDDIGLPAGADGRAESPRRRRGCMLSKGRTVWSSEDCHQVPFYHEVTKARRREEVQATKRVSAFCGMDL